MAKNRKKKQRDELPDVLTAHREKAEREEGRDGSWARESDQPNGCSGNYS